MDRTTLSPVTQEILSVLKVSLAIARRRLYGDDSAADAYASSLARPISEEASTLAEQLTAYGMAVAALAATLNRREAKRIVAQLLREAFPQHFATPAANGSHERGSSSGGATAQAASPQPQAASRAPSQRASRKKV